MKKTLLTISTMAVLGLLACGSKPEPAPVAQPEAEVPAPATIQAAPATDPAPAPAAVQPGTPEQAAQAGAQPAIGPDGKPVKQYKGDPNRQFIITDLSVAAPRAVNVGEIKLKNPEAIRNFRPVAPSEVAPPGSVTGSDMQTPTAAGLRRPAFQPKNGQQAAPAQGEGK